MKIPAVLAAAVSGAGAPVFGSSLISIGVLDPTDATTAYSEVRAVSSDGAYAVGSSKAPGGINVPIAWSASDGLVALPNPSGQNSIAHGVAVGISANVGNIMISGLHEGNLVHRWYKAPLTGLATGAWSDTASTGGLGGVSNVRGGTSNDLRNQVAGDGRWYTGGRRADTTRICRLRGDPFIGWDGSSPLTCNQESGYGVGVGRYTGVTPSTARWDSPISGETGDVPGPAVRADGFGISPSFGKSTSTDFGVQWICGQVQNYNGDGTTMQAFRWNRADASMTFLGSLSPAGGGDVGDNSAVAYTVADNGVTAGKSYFGAVSPNTSYEVATVWDTSGTWSTTGTAKSVETLLAADGVDISAWTHLTRVYAASDDGTVLAGYGIWAADGSQRGFLAVKTVVRITSMALSGGTVTIGFTSSSTSDTPASFAVQSAGTLVNGGTAFANLSSPATITGSAGTYQATFPSSGNATFYRIKRL